MLGRHLKKPRPEEVWVRWTPHPVIVTIGDNRDYIGIMEKKMEAIGIIGLYRGYIISL